MDGITVHGNLPFYLLIFGNIFDRSSLNLLIAYQALLEDLLKRSYTLLEEEADKDMVAICYTFKTK